MSSTTKRSLSPSALTGLVRLRAILERAVREAEDGSEPGRHIALVTLDGGCEYAVCLAAHHRGMALRPDTSIYAGIDALSKHLREWKQTGVRSVVELHAARNQAQHMGLLADRELTSGWVIGTRGIRPRTGRDGVRGSARRCDARGCDTRP